MTEDLSKFSWRRTNAPTASSRTDDIWFLDERTGWAVNSNGQILKTEDGGDNWQTQAQFEGVYLRCVGFANERVGWAGSVAFDGPDDRLYHTTDGGQNWTLATGLPEAPQRICGLNVVDEKTLFVAGTNYPHEHAAVAKTTDGGRTWTEISLRRQATLLVDIYFKDANEGWVVGGENVVNHPDRKTQREDVIPVVLHTTDGGATWVNQVANLKAAFPRGEWGWKIHVLDEQRIFVSLENFHDGAYLRSDDGGQSWKRIRINDRQRNSNLEGIGFASTDLGWVGGWGDYTLGGGYTSATTDGGTAWNDANEVGFRLNRFRFIGRPVRVGYASGDTVYKFSSEPVAEAAFGARQEAPVSDGIREVEFEAFIPAGSDRLRVEIYERFGRRVAEVIDERDPAGGARTVRWDFKDADGKMVAPGGYVVRVTAGPHVTSSIVHRLGDDAS